MTGSPSVLAADDAPVAACDEHWLRETGQDWFGMPLPLTCGSCCTGTGNR